MYQIILIEKDYTKTSSSELLVKEWFQWRRIRKVFFEFNKEDFQKFELKSPKKEHKEVDIEFPR